MINNDRKYFVDVVRDWVNEIVFTGGVYYEHGHPIEIIDKLMTKDRQLNKFNKYPLICLFQDFDEKIVFGDDFYELPTITIMIIASSKREYNAAERYAKTFKPILYPIMEQLLQTIEYSSHVSSTIDSIEYTKTDRLFWGKQGVQGNEGTVFADYLDCIELKINNLRIKKLC